MYSQTRLFICLKNVDGKYIGLSTVDGYKYRPYELSDKSLYEWIQIYERLKRTKAEQKKFQSQKHEDVKSSTMVQSDEEMNRDFESDLDYLESDQTLEKEEIQRKF